jgi:peptidoglycan/LPS O-acetylase OafA/YrhL
MQGDGARSFGFRADINGLRAWAVVAVILYHFGVPGFSGGFVGVDVFFVISGFLMTSIIVQGLESGSFSLGRFYLARARRIVPALALLCAVLLVLGWFVLMAPDYRQLATHVVYSLSFLSNVEFWKEAGYFDAASHEKWLLHTWSLSVEWQFYMLLPLALWATWRAKAGRAVQTLVIASGFLLSCAASIGLTASEPTASFFLLHTRAWEMLAGGLVFLLGQPKLLTPLGRRMLEQGGLLLIVFSVAVFGQASAWPGWRAMLPVAGAAMVVAANGSSAMTANRVAQWLGDRSYSLYLWHWPIYVGLCYAEKNSAPLAVCAALLLTLLFGHLSTLLVERPAKAWLTSTPWRGAAAIALALFVVVLPGIVVWKMQGIEGRFSPAVEVAAAEAANVNLRREQCHVAKGATSPACIYGGGPAKVMLVGDSHANTIVTALAAADAGGKSGVVQWTYSGCVYLPEMKMAPSFMAKMAQSYQCTEFNGWVRRQVNAAPAAIPVVIAGRYAAVASGANEHAVGIGLPIVYFSTVYSTPAPAFLKEFSEHIVSTACEAAKQRPVYLLRPIPEMGIHVPKMMSRRLSLGGNGDVSISTEEYMLRNGWIIAAQDHARATCGVKILDPLPVLCHDGRCHGTQAGRALYSDDNHLSEFGNKLLVPMFAEVFRGL